MILAEAIGAGFTGKITIEVNLKGGGIASASASRSGEMISGESFRFGAPKGARHPGPLL